MQLGFTLVEILIVVVVLGILAAAVAPQFASAANAARAGSVKTQLFTLQGHFERVVISMGGRFTYDPHDGTWWELTKRGCIKQPPVSAAWQGAGVGDALEVTSTAGVRGSATAAWVRNNADMTLYASYFNEATGSITTNATD